MTPETTAVAASFATLASARARAAADRVITGDVAAARLAVAEARRALDEAETALTPDSSDPVRQRLAALVERVKSSTGPAVMPLPPASAPPPPRSFHEVDPDDDRGP